MVLALKEFSHIRKDRDRIILYHDDSIAYPGIHYISPYTATILCLLDALGTKEAVTQMLTQITGAPLEKTEVLVNKVASDYDQYFTTVHDPSPHPRYDAKQFIIPFDKNPQALASHRLDYPIRLSWICTWRCNRKCVFCGVDFPGFRQLKLRSSVDRMLDVFDEAYKNGTTKIVIHGGEPFLYEYDLTDFINSLRSMGYYIHTSTRSLFDRERAQRLKRTGLDHLQVSIDTLNPETAKKLYGTDTIVRDVRRTVEELHAVGIGLHVNTLVTAKNIREIPALMRQLAAFGVERITISWFRRSPAGDPEGLFAEQADREWLEQRMDGIIADLSDDLEIYYSPHNVEDAKKERAICSSGREELVVLPDGRVTLCDFLSNDDRFIVGNINEQSLGEIWDSPELARWVAPQNEWYEGTVCHGCKLFDRCSSKGFCYVRSLQASDRPFSPDYQCPRAGTPAVQLS